VLSVHWGGNWGWDAGVGQQEFAKAVIDECRVDVVWGHSSHHVKGVQVYRDKLILYGAGDFINDYEGIDSRDGREAEFGAGIGGVYLVSFQGGKLSSLELLPSRIKHLAANKACRADAEWLPRMRSRCRAGASTRPRGSTRRRGASSSSGRGPSSSNGSGNGQPTLRPDRRRPGTLRPRTGSLHPRTGSARLRLQTGDEQ